jgi:streptomycin 6-kinase
VTGPAHDRARQQIHAWGVVADETRETDGSILTFGTRGDRAIVLKVTKQLGDERRCGEVLDAFDGHGVIRPLAFADGAVLMDRLQPGTPLAQLSLAGRDAEATGILAHVIREMSPPRHLPGLPCVEDFAGSFETYLTSGHQHFPSRLVEDAQQAYADLCKSQTAARLLHGDLHHYNVLRDDQRGWLAIDPKGVVGELEYELGASLRNPFERPELFIRRETLESRLRVFEKALDVDSTRVLRWAYAQAVLATIWLVEDGMPCDGGHPVLALARVARSMLA